MPNQGYTLIDFFSGAGGFSEGFRQQGFQILKGIDCWEPAVKTHNLNHNLNDEPENVLDFMGLKSSDVFLIENLPDSDVIVGSPSCVTFSMSNKAGKADKTEGLKLIEAYLRIIAVKKHKKKSKLKAWLMENVPNSGNYVKKSYTFRDLNLEDWAINNTLDPDKVAIKLNGIVLNASDYGAPQNRSRFICGEWVKDESFPNPENFKAKNLTLGEIRNRMPKPNAQKPVGKWSDPNYPNLKLEAVKISDHFYDTGLYTCDWDQAKFLKTMHPFMGKMSFPENETKTSRTITATKSASSREALIYESEYCRKGHGQYRNPTIREIASLMGYPYTYQFYGSEGIKWKLIGNSVSPQLSSALAKAILQKAKKPLIDKSMIDFESKIGNYKFVDNLNTFKEKQFTLGKTRKGNVKFRRPIHKSLNITVDLLNYNPETKYEVGNSWNVYIFRGTGPSHKLHQLDCHDYINIKNVLISEISGFSTILDNINKLKSQTDLSYKSLQDSYISDSSLTSKNNPIFIMSKLSKLIKDSLELSRMQKMVEIDLYIKEKFTLEQLIYMFAVSHLFNISPSNSTNLHHSDVYYTYPI